MHRPPPVRYPVRRSPVLGGFLVLIWAMGLILEVVWFLLHRAAGDQTGASWLVFPLFLPWVCGAFAAWAWFRMPPGWLVWDGAAWSFAVGPNGGGNSTAEAHVTPEVRLDLQGALLIGLRGGKAAYPRRGPRTAWVWVEASQAPGRWMALRRTLFADPVPDHREPDTSRQAEA